MSDIVSPIRCIVCLSSISNDGPRRPVSLFCGHVYCDECAERIERCGVCRAAINRTTIRPLFVELNPEFGEHLAESYRTDTERLRADSQRLNTLCNNLNVVSYRDLISALSNIEDHPYFVHRPIDVMARRLCTALQARFAGFRIASGLANQCGAFSFAYSYIHLMVIMDDRQPVITQLRQNINASTHKMLQNAEQYGFSVGVITNYRNEAQWALELIELINFNLDELSLEDGIRRLDRIFNSIHGLSLVFVMRVMAKMHYIDLIDVLATRIGHSNSREEFADSICNGMLLEGHLLLLSDLFAVNITVFDVRTVGQEPTVATRIAVNRMVTANLAQDNIPEIFLFQSEFHYDVLVPRIA